MKRTSRGFTIVELMIAMAIFMIICAIAIPNYMTATQRAHEAVAVSFLRQVETGQEAYRLNSQQYADSFAKLQPYISADLIQPALPHPGLDLGLTSMAYAEPLPPGTSSGKGGANGGNSGSAPGNGGSSPGNSGSAPGQTGSNPGQGGASAPGQSGSAPGQTGSNPGQGGAGAPGQSGSAPGLGGTGSGSSGNPSPSSNPGGSATATPDTKVYSMYIFQLTLTDTQHWSCTAQPIRDRLNGKFFYTDQTNVIHISVGSLADALSPQL